MTKKSVFIRLKNLLINTNKEWKNIADEDREGKEVISKFALPLIGFLTLASFVGSLFNNQIFDFEVSIKVALTDFLSAYGSVYLSMLLINLAKPLFHLQTNTSRTLSFVGYTYGLIFGIEILTNLFPEFYLLRILVVYTLFIIWEGVAPMFKVREEQRTGFALVCSLIILVLPFLLDYLLKLIIPGNSVL